MSITKGSLMPKTTLNIIPLYTKIILGITLLLSSFNFAMAQGTTDQNPYKQLKTQTTIIKESSPDHFLLEVGYIGATTSDAPSAQDFKHGFAGGVLIDLYGKRYFTFETGVMFYQQGFSYSTTSLSNDNGVSLSKVVASGSLDYVGFPLLGKLNFMGRLSNTVYLIGGVTPQILVAKNLSIQGYDENNNQKQYNLTSDQYDVPPLDVSASLGAGFNLAFSNTQSLLVQATYNQGLIPIDYRAANPGIYNQSLMITIGFGTDIL